MKLSFTFVSKCVLTVFFVSILQPSIARTDKYRIMWRDNPSTTMVIGWNQVSGSNPVVYYGPVDQGTNYSAYPNSKTPDRVVGERGMNNHFARLTGLQPNTAYYFVIKDSEGVSQRFWFKTVPDDPNVRLSFVAGGDSRNNRVPRQNANKLVAKLRPHAVFFGGDMTDNGYNSQWQTWFDDWQLTTGSDGRMIPIVATRGNHESANSIIVNLFDVPSSNVYYGLTFGGNLVRMYTLNTEMSISGNQTTWLANDLQSNKNVSWKMAQYHKPMRPHVSYKSEGNAQYSNWANLFYQNNVKLVVECDAHTVKTTWPVKPYSGSGSDEGFIRDDENGTTYVGEGCWGAPLRSNDDNKNWTRNSGRFNQFKWIFVDQEKIEVRTIKTDNADNVGRVSDANIFQIPSNLDIWNPSNGAVVTINNNSGGGGDPQPNPNVMVTSRVNSSANDAEERQNGGMYLNSSDLELVYDSYESAGNQKVGMRFTGLNIPQGASIKKAYLQFTTDETSSETTSLLIRAENTDNASVFTSTANNISNRSLTNTSVNWSPSAWSSTGETGSNQQTPDISALVQEVVNRSGWSTSSALAFVITGTGKRVAESYDGSSSKAPLLYVEYTTTTSNALTISRTINNGMDDVEEESDGDMYTNSSDLELINDGWFRGNQTVGLRFTNISVPQAAIIEEAYIQFTSNETSADGTNIVISAQDTDDAPYFSTSKYNISSRAKTSASISWSPAAWNTSGERDAAQKTPDLKAVVQEVVNRSGWQSGNALAFILQGSGKRTADAYEGNAANAPKLVLKFKAPATVTATAKNTKAADYTERKVKESVHKEIEVYPVPFEDKLMIRSAFAEKVMSVRIYDTWGRLHLHEKVKTTAGGEIELNTEKLSSGDYVLVLEGEGTRISKKIRK